VVFELELTFNYLVLLVVMSACIEAAFFFVFAGLFLPEGGMQSLRNALYFVVTKLYP
jgi:hypothetical protein